MKVIKGYLFIIFLVLSVPIFIIFQIVAATLFYKEQEEERKHDYWPAQ